MLLVLSRLGIHCHYFHQCKAQTACHQKPELAHDSHIYKKPSPTCGRIDATRLHKNLLDLSFRFIVYRIIGGHELFYRGIGELVAALLFVHGHEHPHESHELGCTASLNA